jgi:hypothetical protein
MTRCTSAARAPFSFLLLLVASAAACGGAAPPTQAPSAALAAPPVAAPAVAQPDLSPVPRPSSLVAFARSQSVDGTIGKLRSLLHLPLPNSQDLLVKAVGEAVASTLDLSQPWDWAAAVDSEHVSLDSIDKHLVFAFSLAVKDAAPAKATLAEHFKLVPLADGGQLISGLGEALRKEAESDPDHDPGADDDTTMTCELAPAFGPASMRIVCTLGNTKGQPSLVPWLTRGATRLAPGPDLHFEAFLKPFRPLLQEQGKMMTGLASAAATANLSAGARGLVSAYLSDLVDFFVDLDGESLDLNLSETSARLEVSARFGSNNALLTRLSTSGADRNGPPPPAFWHLPADASTFGFQRGFDDALIAHARDMVLQVAGDELAKQGVKAADRKALTDSLKKLAVVPASAFASGFDVDGLAKAVAALPRAGAVDAPSGGASLWPMGPVLLGWRVIELDVPWDHISGAAGELVAALARLDDSNALRGANKSGPLRAPSFHTASLPKIATAWPKGSFHTTVLVPPPAPAAAAKGAKARTALKPLVIHVLVVPDGSRTWVGVGGDEAVLAAKVNTALTGTGETLESRADLASFKTASLGSASSLTMAGTAVWVASLAAIVDAEPKVLAGVLKAIAELPHHGSTPLVVRSAATGSTPPFSLTGSFEVSREFLEDVTMLAAKRGGM